MYLFAHHGYDGTTNRAIAEACGLTGAAIYHYFDSKAELYAAVYETVFARVFDQLEAAVACQSTLVSQYAALLERHRPAQPRRPDRLRRSSSAWPATPSATPS